MSIFFTFFVFFGFKIQEIRCYLVEKRLRFSFSLILFAFFPYSKTGSNSIQIHSLVDEVISMLQTRKAHLPRFIDVEDGQFIEFRQTKESYYLETHQEKQTQLTEPFPMEQVSVKEEESSFVLSKNKSKTFVFLIVMLLMGFVSWNLSQVFWQETEIYLSTSGPSIMTGDSFNPPSTNSTNDKNQSTTAMNSTFGYVVHTQHKINDLYEETKGIVQNFSIGNLTHQEKVEKTEELIKALEEMESYNDSFLGSETNSNIKKYYQLNQERLQTLKEGLEGVKACTYRSQTITLINEKILVDQTTYQVQLNVFKAILDEQKLNYYEKDGKLFFEFK